MDHQPPSSVIKEANMADIGKGRRVTGDERGKLAIDLKNALRCMALAVTFTRLGGRLRFDSADAFCEDGEGPAGTSRSRFPA